MTGGLDRVMLDIETLGLDPGAVILSIGAVRFGAGELGETFERPISLQSCQDAGLSIDAGTLDWWLQQDDAAQAVLNGGDDLEEVLAAFASWYRDADEIWANSPSFDCELLGYAYDVVGLEPPWQYYEERDYRTLSSLSIAPEIDHDGVEHDALDDATHQAHVAAATLKRLENAERTGDSEPEPITDGGSVQPDSDETGARSVDDTDRFTDCEACGGPVDMLEPGVWKTPNDEQWWHEACYDKVEKAEELAERIRSLMVPEGEFDGLSDEFHQQLDAAQAFLETGVERERLKREQEVGPYSTETDRSEEVSQADE